MTNEYKPDDRVEDEDSIDDQILDSFLEEMLAERTPPDLASRIVHAWEVESKGATDVVLAKPIRAGAPTVVATLLSSQEASTQQQGSGLQVGSGRWYLPVLALAAALAFILVGWNWLNSRVESSSEQVAELKNSTESNPTNTSLVNGAEQPASEATQEKEPTVAPIPLDDLPFSRDQIAGAGGDKFQREVEADRSQKLPSQMVVARVDAELKALWALVGVTPSPSIALPERLRMISSTLTGREIADTAASQFGDGGRDIDLLRFAMSASDSLEFRSKFARSFAHEWLSGSAFEQNDDAIQEIEKQVINNIGRGRPFNRVVVDLMTPPSDVTSAGFLGAWVDGDNHKLVENIGRHFLNANLACTRCHDRQSADSPLETQQTYWSIAAMLNGLASEWDGEREQRVLRDRQAELFANAKPSVFYERPNGVLRAANPELPGGEAWSVSQMLPRQSLATWISDSQAMDEAIVNQVWKLCVGRELVPLNEDVELAGINQRKKLLQFLAGQYRAYDRDIRQLASWIAVCEATNRSPQNLSRVAWLNATDEQLEQLQLAETVFASAISLGTSAESRTLEQSLLAALDWSGNRSASATDSLLAQPSSELATNLVTPGSEQENNRTASMPAQSFAIHGERFTPAQIAFVNRLLKSSQLAWKDQVEHILALTGQSESDDRLQDLASELLQRSGGDARGTLLKLLWSVENAKSGRKDG